MNTLPGAFGWWGETTVPGMQRARLMNVGNRSLWHLRQFGVVWSLRTLLSRVCGELCAQSSRTSISLQIRSVLAPGL